MNRQRQRGVALITGLIFLVVLTLLAVAAMRTTGLDEKMAGNALNQNAAFQSAEAAIRIAEKFLDTSNAGAGLPAFNGSVTGYYQNLVTNNSDAFWTAYNWGAGSVLTSSGLAGVAQQPRYVIEKMNVVPPGQSIKSSSGTATNSVYRITARGVGGDVNTVAILQSTFLKN
jgi:type IV pilus assembly protein PilX